MIPLKRDSGIKCEWCKNPIMEVMGNKDLKGFVRYREGVFTPEGYYHSKCLRQSQDEQAEKI